MKKQFLLLISFFSLTITNVYCQSSTFFKSYDVETKSEFNQPTQMILAFDSSYVIACHSYDSTIMSTTIELIKLDPLGGVVWRKSFQSQPVYSCQLAQTPDSGFVIAACTAYPANNTLKTLMIKTDKFGIAQWTKLFGDTAISQINYDLQVVGNTIFAESHGTISLGNNQYEDTYFILSADLSGNILWYKNYNWLDHPYPHAFAVSQQKEIFVGGEVVNSGYEYLSLSKIDSSGNLLWSKVYNPAGDIQPLKMMLDSSGDLIFTGHKWIGTHNSWDIFLMKIDTAGNFQWGKNYGGFSDDEGWGVFQSQNGYVICAEPESFNNASRASLMQTDSVGNLVWMKIYGDTTGSFPNTAVQLKNGFAIYGIKGSYGDNVPIYLLKTDINGITSCKWNSVVLPDSSFTLAPIDTGSSGTVQGVMTITLLEDAKPLLKYDECNPSSVNDLWQDKFISIYPNPFSSYTTLKTEKLFHNATLLVYNSYGQMVREMNGLSGDEIIFYRNGLANGLYFFRVTEKNEVLMSGKMMVTGD